MKDAHQGENGLWYPTYRFNRSQSQVQVEDEAADRALVGEWFDHPPTEASEPIVHVTRDAVDDMVDEEVADGDTKKKKKK